MSITKSFNKHLGVFYAYETTYEWDESLQKRVQKKTCIGHFDPQTNEVIPNGRRGRPSKSASSPETTVKDAHVSDYPDITSLRREWDSLTDKIRTFEGRMSEIRFELSAVSKKLAVLVSEMGMSERCE